MSGLWNRYPPPSLLLQALSAPYMLKQKLDDFSTIISELRTRQDYLSKTMVRVYAQDLRTLLERADFIEKNTFLRSFTKRIEVNKKQVTI